MLFKKQETELFQSLMDQDHLLDIDLFGTRCNFQNFVQLILKDLDPEGTDSRRRHRLRRRIYRNSSPNYAWHINGHDKLKPFGFAIHGAIDGYNRKILWLRILRSNNSSSIIGNIYLDCVKKFQGCPIKLITDLGSFSCSTSNTF